MTDLPDASEGSDLPNRTDNGEVPEWISDLGITDRQSGVEQARKSLGRLHGVAKATLREPRKLYVGHMLLMGLTTRAVGLHHAAVSALESDNPFAAFTLIRAYAENAATALYAIDKPAAIDRLAGIATPPVSIGRITNHAMRGSKRFGAFREVYSELSQFAHPMSKSIFASTKTHGHQGFEWSTIPAFKAEDDFLTASAWIVEMGRANAHLLRELGELLNSIPSEPTPTLEISGAADSDRQ